MDLEAAVLYHLAFGLASDLAEAHEHNFPGRWRANAAAGGTVEAIAAEVVRRLGAVDRAGRELV